MNVLRVAFVLLLVCTACGRRTGPVEIPADDLPFDVSRTEGPVDTPAAARSYAVYLVRDDALVELPRELETDDRPAVAVLRALLVGPQEDERARGLETEIPQAVRLLDVSIVDDTARVDLSGEFQEPSRPDTIALRVAQVVWTLTALDAVGSVSFSIDGEPVAVTTDDGAAVERRVSRRDYNRFAPAR
jgi:spore germination protein GerM